LGRFVCGNYCHVFHVHGVVTVVGSIAFLWRGDNGRVVVVMGSDIAVL